MAAPENGPVRVDHASLVRLTYENNLRVTAARYDVEAAEFQFRRFERNLSQFKPLILQSGVDREVESVLDGSNRVSTRDDDGRVSLGMEKEFFDGTRIGASTGVRQTWNDDGSYRSPFVAFEGRFPLFSSATRLERVTARSFEESEMLGSWLDFIQTIRFSIGASQDAYFDFQYLFGLRAQVLDARQDFSALLAEPEVSDHARDVNLIRDQLQAYQSRLVEHDGDIAAAHIRLMDRLGLVGVPLEAIEKMDLHASPFYGAGYLDAPLDVLIGQALDNDVEIRVMHIAGENARLKRRLAERGKWDIVGRVLGTYDFDREGDDPTHRRGYRAGVAFSVERSDPQLLRLSLQRAQAEERKFSARIEYRRRQIENDIRRRMGQAQSLRGVIHELEVSLDLRRTVFEEKRAAFLDGEDTLDNVIQSRGQLFSTERSLLASLSDFFEIVIELDQASGAYFAQLGDAVARFEQLGLMGGGRESNASMDQP